MAVNSDFPPAFIVFSSDITFFYSTAKKFKDDAIAIRKKYSTCTPSFHLLSSIACELFPKVYIACKISLKNKNYTNIEISEGKIKAEIESNMTKYGHDLVRLYNNLPELMSYLDIKSIKEYPDDKTTRSVAWQYNFEMKDGRLLGIKNVEGIRYGSFAKNSDILTLCVYDDDIVRLLDKLDEFIESKMKQTRIELMK